MPRCAGTERRLSWERRRKGKSAWASWSSDTPPPRTCFPGRNFQGKRKIKYFPLRLKCVCAASSPSTGGLLTSNGTGSRIRSFACGVLSSSLDTGLNNDFANINSSTPSHHLSSWCAEQPGFPWALLYFHRMNYSIGLQGCDI